MPPSEQNANDSPAPDLPVAKPVKPVSPRPAENGFEYVDEGYDDFDFRPRTRGPRKVTKFVRVMLAVMAVGFTAVLITAMCIRPYDADGNPYTMGTHQQLGLQACNMVVLTGKPCPACGMTTSFALLMHGDVANSLKANWVGTLFCASLLVLTPWAVAGAYRGRLVWVRNGELFATILLAGLLLLMMGRWVVILAT